MAITAEARCKGIRLKCFTTSLIFATPIALLYSRQGRASCSRTGEARASLGGSGRWEGGEAIVSGSEKSRRRCEGWNWKLATCELERRHLVFNKGSQPPEYARNAADSLSLAVFKAKRELRFWKALVLSPWGGHTAWSAALNPRGCWRSDRMTRSYKHPACAELWALQCFTRQLLRTAARTSHTGAHA